MKKILVIEDDAPTGWLLERMLRGKHYVVLMNNATDAWQWLLEGNTCDVIIVDLNQSSDACSGLLENVRTHIPLGDVPVMVLSNTDQSRSEVIRLGTAMFLLKPYERQRLLMEVRVGIEKLTETVLIVSCEEKNKRPLLAACDGEPPF